MIKIIKDHYCLLISQIFQPKNSENIFFGGPKLNLEQFNLDLYSITSDRKISLRFRFMFFKFDSTLSRKNNIFPHRVLELWLRIGIL